MMKFFTLKVESVVEFSQYLFRYEFLGGRRRILETENELKYKMGAEHKILSRWIKFYCSLYLGFEL